MNVALQQNHPYRTDQMAKTTTNEVLASLSSGEVFSNLFIETEIKKLPWDLLCLLDLADQLVRRGTRYRRYRRDRTLSLKNLARTKRRLSCSEFIWYLLSLAGLNVGEHPLSSKRMAFRRVVYPEALEKVSGLDIRIGDILVYAHSREVLKSQRELFGKSEVGHVVMVVSTQPKIVVGSHGLESTPEGEPTGAGYRRLLCGWRQWTKQRPLQAVYRVRSIEGKKQ